MIKTTVTNHLTVRQQIELLKMPPVKRKRINGQIVRKVKSASRKRLRSQRNINGTPWARRADDSKRKMMRKLGRKMETRYNDRNAIVKFSTPAIGRVATAQQKGIDETFTKAKAEKRYGTPDYDAPATRKQAKALKKEGFKQRRRDGKPFKPTIRWFTENMKQGQAGLILREMRDKPSINSWVIELPARTFLGATEQEIDGMVQTIFDQTTNAKA